MKFEYLFWVDHGPHVTCTCTHVCTKDALVCKVDESYLQMMLGTQAKKSRVEGCLLQ